MTTSSFRRLIQAVVFAAIALAVGPAPAQNIELDTATKRFSYAVGLTVTQSVMRQVDQLDRSAFMLAIRDALDGAKPRLDADAMQAALSSGQNKVTDDLKQRARENLERGMAFLAENKTKKGVEELSSGLQYKILREGSGAFPKPSDEVTVHYVGTLIDGTEFDSSKRRGEPITFSLNGVIKGWQEALPLMRTGSRWQIFVPPALAYGPRGAGSAIGPNEALVFEIELLGIK